MNELAKLREQVAVLQKAVLTLATELADAKELADRGPLVRLVTTLKQEIAKGGA